MRGKSVPAVAALALGARLVVGSVLGAPAQAPLDTSISAGLDAPAPLISSVPAGLDAPAPLDWSFPASLNTPAPEPGPGDHAVATDPLGGVHVVWVDTSEGTSRPALAYRARPAGGGWEPARRVLSPEPGAVIVEPDVAVDALGGVHVVWAESQGADMDIFASALLPGSGTWTRAERVNDADGGAEQEHPALAGDLWGGIHVVWTDYRWATPQIYSRGRRPSGAWTPESVVNNDRVGDHIDPDITLDRAGTLHVVWSDTRAGPSEIFESRAPHGALDPSLEGPVVWWPNARLNRHTGPGRQSAPQVAADGEGDVIALWIDDDRRLVSAILRHGEDFWDEDRVIYRPSGPRISSLSLAAGVGSLAVAAWRENTTAGSALMSGAVPAEGALEAQTLDGTPISYSGRAPRLAMGPYATIEAVWSGRHRFGTPELFFSEAALEPPAYEVFDEQGWIHYVPRRLSCPGDGYVLVDCDGAMGPFILASEITPSFIGRYVRVRGVIARDSACPTVRAGSIVLGSSPCNVATGSVTGLLESAARPAFPAEAHMGEARARAGPSGRFFFPDVPGGTHVVTATAPCALVAQTEVRVQPGFTRVLQPASLIRADVVGDCAVNLSDLIRVTRAYREPPPFRPACADLDDDGAVTIYDVAAVSGSFGVTCPTDWSRDGDTSPQRVTESSGRRDGPAGPGELRLTASRNVRAFEVELPYRPAAVPSDAGVPFAGVDAETVLLNVADSERGVLRLAAARLAPDAGFVPGTTLAMLASGYRDAVAGPALARLADDRGAPLAGGVSIGPLSAAARGILLPFLRKGLLGLAPTGSKAPRGYGWLERSR